MNRALPCCLAVRSASTSSSEIWAAVSYLCSSQTSRWSVLSSLRLVSSCARQPALSVASHLDEMKNVLPLRSQPGCHHPLVLAAGVPAGTIEVVDAQVGGPGDHGRVGRDHGAVADARDLHAGLAQNAVSDLTPRRGPLLRSRSGGGRCRCQTGGRQSQTSGQEIAPRSVGFHCASLNFR